MTERKLAVSSESRNREFWRVIFGARLATVLCAVCISSIVAWGNPPTGISAQGKYVLGVANYQVGQQPSGLVVADFNGDGIADIATTSGQDKTISILLGNADGTMSQPKIISLSSGISAIATGDFNGDGHQDLAVIDSDNSYVWILVGIGDGTFQPPVPYATSLDPTAITVWDVNGDGKLDLITGNLCTPSISVLLGNGDGTFRQHVDYDAEQGAGCGVGPSVVAIGDLNGDGKPDLAVATSTFVSVLLGNGDGTFQSFVPYGNGAPATGVAIGDFNADQNLDLVVTRTNNTVSILLGVGDGTFPTETDYPAANAPTAAFVADFNGDGKLDIVTANEQWGAYPPPFGSVSVLLGNGDGTFQPHLDYGTGASPILAAADFNGDGRIDLAVASQNCQNYQPCGVGQLSLVLGNGDGTFPQALSIPVTNLSNGIAATDLNGDGNPDLIVGNWNGVSVLLGNGTGSFQQEVDYPATYGTYALVTADFNGDHHPDVALLNSGVSVLLGNGDGTLRGHIDFATAPSQTDMIVGDFNNDGKLDLATVGAFGTTVSILLGNGDGTFSNHVEYPAGSSGFPTMGVAAGDFNRDGKLDLAVTNFNNAGTVSILFGNGDGTFQLPVPVNSGSDPEGIVVGDFNGDGKLDIAVQNYYNSFGVSNVNVLLGNGDGTFQPPVSYPTGDTPIAIKAADVDGDGVLDLILPMSQYVAVLYGNGDGTFRSPVDYLRTNSYGSVLAADLTGNGVTDLAITGTNGGSSVSLQLNSPEIGLRPNPFTFYQQPIGDTGLSKTFSLNNPSVAPLSLSSIAAVGDFNQTNTCPSVLAVGSNCSLTANFKPTLAGLRTGGVLIRDNAPSGLAGLFFSGLGYAITLTPSGKDFGSVGLGNTATQQVVLANLGGAAISINNITIVGPDSGDFSQTNTCGNAIPANSSCTMTLNFRPTKIGTKLAAVSITDTDALSSRSIPLQGNGTDFSVTTANGGTTAVTVSAGQTATYTLDVNPLGGFSGAVAVTCSGAPSSSSCTAAPSSVSLNGNSPVPITIDVTTTATVQMGGLLGRPSLRWGPPRIQLFLWLALAFTVLLSMTGFRPRLQKYVVCFGLIAVLMSFDACGGGSQKTSTSSPGTPAGTYNLVVTATCNGVSRTVNLSLTVQ